MIVSYLLGAVPVGYLLARVKGVDIRRVGSGNIGATNVLRALGVKYGLLCFALDVLKGAAPILAVRHFLGWVGWPVAACAAAAVIGHCFSPYLRFAGGKAVATGLGVLLGLNWVAGLVCFALWGVMLAVTRTVSLSSIVAYAAAPVVARLLGADVPAMITILFLLVLCLERHRENIRRLLAGTENKVGRRKAAPDAVTDPPEGGTSE